MIRIIAIRLFIVVSLFFHLQEAMLLRSNWFCTNILIVRHGQSGNNITYDLIRQRFGDTLSAEEFEIELNKLHDPDCGLSPVGLRQAEHLGNYIQSGNMKVLKVVNKWKIISSPMKRCLLTSQQVARGFGEGTKVSVHPRFFESDGCYRKAEDGSSVGLPGMTAEEVESHFPNYHCLPGMESGWFHLPKKETAREFKDRAKELVEYLWQTHYHRVENHKTQYSNGHEVKEETKGTNGSQNVHKSSLNDHNEGFIIVAHGNLLRAVVSNLLGTYSMITSDNTGVSHLQLWSSLEGNHAFASVQFLNNVEHLLSEPNLISGNEIFDDHWIQEYLVDDNE
jgi:broad specificity phosphatase PhoE